MKPTHTSISVLVASMIIFVQVCCIQAHAEGGIPLWTNFYRGYTPTAMGVDSNGNVFVTGQMFPDIANSTSDYGTVAYSSNGDPLWTNCFNGAANDYDQAQAIAVDRNGNVFVTGFSTATNGRYDYVTIAYSGAGLPLWTNLYNGPTNLDDIPYGIATDSNGNVFVTGVSGGFATVAYSGVGVPFWTNRYSGPNNAGAAAQAIAVDNDGNVIVTGAGVNGGQPYETIKYSNAGVPLWTNLYNGSVAKAVAVDAQGSVFVTGGGPNPGEFATIKYSSSGLPLWTNHYNTQGLYYTSANAIAVDNQGSAFVTGPGFVTIKYSSSGLSLWTNHYSGSASTVVLDSAGNVLVAGTTGTMVAGAIVAYSNAGVPLWTNHYDSYQFVAIAVDRNDNVIVTGAANNKGSYVTIKFSSSAPPRLDFHKLNNQLVLSWTNTGFKLQSAPAVTGTFTDIPNATSPYTNSFTGPQQFFRLIGN